MPSRATRRIPLGARTSYRGSVIDYERNVEVLYESNLERDFIVLMLADPRVIDFVEQPPAVSFVEPSGRVAKHTFDALVHLQDGRRVAVDVKPKAKVIKSGIQEVQDLIREQIGCRYADLYVIRTEENMHPDDVADAALLLRARRLPNPEADAALTAMITTLIGWCRLGDLVKAAGKNEGAAFNAAVRLIGNQALEVRDEQRISYNCYVRRRSA